MNGKTVNKTVTVSSHPRAGSHWLMRLIDINFFDGKDYLKHYGGHPFGDTSRVTNFLTKRNNLTVYISRNTIDTARSVFAMRNRFGLRENDFDTFITRPIASMYSRSGKASVIRDTIAIQETVSDIDYLFANRPENILEYIDLHKLTWDRHSCLPHFCHITYEGLVNDFNIEMTKLAHHFNPGQTEFIDENKRVGWRDAASNEWVKP